MKTLIDIVKALLGLLGLLPALISYLSGHQRREMESLREALETAERLRLAERESHRKQVAELQAAHATEVQRLRDAWSQVVVDRNDLRRRMLERLSAADAIDSLREDTP